METVYPLFSLTFHWIQLSKLNLVNTGHYYLDPFTDASARSDLSTAVTCIEYYVQLVYSNSIILQE